MINFPAVPGWMQMASKDPCCGSSCTFRAAPFAVPKDTSMPMARPSREPCTLLWGFISKVIVSDRQFIRGPSGHHPLQEHELYGNGLGVVIKQWVSQIASDVVNARSK